MRPNALSLLVLLIARHDAAAHTIRVVDEAGSPVKRFEAMYHTADQGYSHWEVGRDGVCSLPIFVGETTQVDVMVRADGYATVLKRLGAVEQRKSSDDEVLVTLTKGQRIKVRLEVPQGVKVVDDLQPETYTPQFAERVRSGWQPVNKRGEQQLLNLLNMQLDADGAFTLAVSDETKSFFIGIDQPDWLRFCELGPFTKEDVVDGVLTVNVPQAAPIEVRFDSGDVGADALPIEKVLCGVMWKNPDGPSGSWYSANDRQATLSDGAYRITDLTPG